MKHTRIVPLLATLGAVTLVACGNVNPPGSQSGAASLPATATHAPDTDNVRPDSAAAPGTNAQSAARGSSGAKAYIDPVTGELREPTAAEQQAEAAARAATSGAPAVKATVPVAGRPIGNGMVEYDVGKRGMVDEVACVQANGTVSGNCPKGAK